MELVSSHTIDYDSQANVHLPTFLSHWSEWLLKLAAKLHSAETESDPGHTDVEGPG